MFYRCAPIWIAFFFSIPSFAALTLTVNQDLAFADAAQGDGAVAINPTTDHVRAAKLTISGGVALAAYTITLPATAINMSQGGANISVSSWTSDPVSGNLDGSGSAVFYVGATHAALSAGQSSGAYTGSFTVSVDSSSVTASASPNATLTALTMIGLTKLSDLAFGVAARNDSVKAITAGSGGSASFTVSGEANRSYSITLPSSVTLTTGAGNTANTQIVVNSFTSSPASPATLSAGGTQTLYVGATRAAISGTQTQGNYTGSFTVTVAYQ